MAAIIHAGEMLMAWLKDRDGSFYVFLRLGDKKVKKSLRTHNRQQADRLLARVEEIFS